MIIKLTRSKDGAPALVNPELILIQPSDHPEKGHTFLVGNGVTLYVEESVEQIERLIQGGTGISEPQKQAERPNHGIVW
jgi:hypothetical protein